MKLTESLKETIAGMHKLKIPRTERREYILGAYSCVGKFRLYPQGLNWELDMLIRKRATPEQSVESIEKYFKSIQQASKFIFS